MKVVDPYKIHILCGHINPLGRLVLTSGKVVPPFTISPGDTPKPDEPALQFVGQVYQEIQWEQIDDEGRQIAELAVVKFHMSAKHPVYGAIDVTLDHTRPGNFGRLCAVTPGKKFPVVHTTSLHVIATIESQPDVILQNEGPAMRFVSDELPVWPPEENVYRLPTKVGFEPRHSKGSIFMTSNEGGAIVGKIRRQSK